AKQNLENKSAENKLILAILNYFKAFGDKRFFFSDILPFLSILKDVGNFEKKFEFGESGFGEKGEWISLINREKLRRYFSVNETDENIKKAAETNLARFTDSRKVLETSDGDMNGAEDFFVFAALDLIRIHNGEPNFQEKTLLILKAIFIAEKALKESPNRKMEMALNMLYLTDNVAHPNFEKQILPKLNNILIENLSHFVSSKMEDFGCFEQLKNLASSSKLFYENSFKSGSNSLLRFIKQGKPIMVIKHYFENSKFLFSNRFNPKGDRNFNFQLETDKIADKIKIKF
ncbi:hypothetical protein MHBO_003529, partial [Bonamia ostreae]